MSVAEGLVTRVAVLGSDIIGSDCITLYTIDQGMSNAVHTTKMPQGNGRLVKSDFAVLWQGPNGEIYKGQ